MILGETCKGLLFAYIDITGGKLKFPEKHEQTWEGWMDLTFPPNTNPLVNRIFDACNWALIKLHEPCSSNYMTKMQKNYKECRILAKESLNHPSIRGAGQYFKAQFRKLDLWYGNYQCLWNQYFTIA